jgi:hypothetical protein
MRSMDYQDSQDSQDPYPGIPADATPDELDAVADAVAEAEAEQDPYGGWRRVR